MRKSIKNTAQIIFLAIWIAVISLPYIKSNSNPSLYLLDVGQGESALIKTKEKTILYDTGPIDNAVLPQLGKYLPPWQKTIDLVIISHLHDDHLGGMPAILDRYQIKEVWFGRPLDNSPLATLVQQKLISEKSVVKEASKYDKYQINQTTNLTAVYPKAYTPSKDAHYNDLVIRVDSAKGSILLTGDLDENEEEIITSDCTIEECLIDTDILQVPHHGSKYGLIPEFLEKVSPYLAFIPVGENKFGHPDPNTIEKITSSNITLKRTDKDGNIQIKLGPD